MKIINGVNNLMIIFVTGEKLANKSEKNCNTKYTSTYIHNNYTN